MPAMSIREASGTARLQGGASRTELSQPEALVDLGLMYSTGDGAPLDPVTAHKWFNLAAQAGNVEARTLREEIAREMSPAQIAEAQRQARRWRGGLRPN